MVHLAPLIHHLLTYAHLKQALTLTIYVSLGMVFLQRLGLLYLRVTWRGRPINWGVNGITMVVISMAVTLIHDLVTHAWVNLAIDGPAILFITGSFIYLYRHVKGRMVMVQRPVIPTPVVQGALHAAATRVRRQAVRAAAANPRRWYAPWTRRH